MITIDVGRTATSHVADVMASMSLDGGGGGGAAGGRATPPIGGGEDAHLKDPVIRQGKFLIMLAIPTGQERAIFASYSLQLNYDSGITATAATATTAAGNEKG